MKLIIDIPKNAYDLLQGEGVDWLGAEHILDAVAKGKPVEKCDYCVSLNAVIDVFDTWWAHNHESDNAIEILEDKLNVLPPVTPQPKIAHVISDEDGNIKCSNCGSHDCWGNYCSECGAKIQEVEE